MEKLNYGVGYDCCIEKDIRKHTFCNLNSRCVHEFIKGFFLANKCGHKLQLAKKHFSIFFFLPKRKKRDLLLRRRREEGGFHLRLTYSTAPSSSSSSFSSSSSSSKVAAEGDRKNVLTTALEEEEEEEEEEEDHRHHKPSLHENLFRREEREKYNHLVLILFCGKKTKLPPPFNSPKQNINFSPSFSPSRMGRQCSFFSSVGKYAQIWWRRVETIRPRRRWGDFGGVGEREEGEERVSLSSDW